MERDSRHNQERFGKAFSYFTLCTLSIVFQYAPWSQIEDQKGDLSCT